jgi:hypothetical protein
LRYDGGWELRICRLISYAAIGGLMIMLAFAAFIRSRTASSY